MPEQLTLFDIPIPPKVFQCPDCACRWVNPLIECPLCHPDTAYADCETCDSHFEYDLYMIEHMRLGGQVQCDLCLPRITPDDCRDPNELAREAEEIRLDQLAQREAVKKLHVRFEVRNDE